MPGLKNTHDEAETFWENLPQFEAGFKVARGAKREIARGRTASCVGLSASTWDTSVSLGRLEVMRSM